MKQNKKTDKASKYFPKTNKKAIKNTHAHRR